MPKLTSDIVSTDTDQQIATQVDSRLNQESLNQERIDQDHDQGDLRAFGPAVGESDHGARLDGYLSKHFPFFSRAMWQKKIAAGHLLVDGTKVKAAYRIRTGQQLRLYSPPQSEPEVDKGIACLWRDEDNKLMAVYKPGNLPMHENGPYRRHTFTHLVWEKFGREWAALHRLDRETSGIVLCCCCPKLRRKITQAWTKLQIKKEYLAIAKGLPQQDHWLENRPIDDLTTSEIRIKKWVTEPGYGQTASTEFFVIGRRERFSLLKVRPRTGRTNQIRIHAAANGLPLVGDKLYHPNDQVFLTFYEQGATDWVLQQTGFKRLCLHAHTLTFSHPVSGREVHLASPMPPDMQSFWDSLVISTH